MEDPSKWVYRPDNDYSVAEHEDERINNGFSVYDAWNGDNYLAWVIVGICKHLKTQAHGYPAELGNDGWDEWMSILDEMIEGFEIHNEEPWVLGDTVENNRARIDIQRAKTDRALELFAKYFGSLWD